MRTKVKTIWHGSENIIEKPLYGAGKIYNDYGVGFYCTENKELAKEWACSSNTDGYANQYEIDMTDMQILNLTDSEYTILNWLALLINNRKFGVSTPVSSHGIQYLTENFLIPIENIDIIIGYRADDSYFTFAKAFVNNEISVEQLKYAMKLGKLGEQVVIKSRKAFDKLCFVQYEAVDNAEYYSKRKSRDENARKQYAEYAQNNDVDGLFMVDIIRKGVLNDDLRLR